MTAISVLSPIVPVRSQQLLHYAAFVQWSQAARLWQGQSLLADPHQTFAAVAGAGFGVPCGLGVTLMSQRHPLEAALQARTLAAATGHPLVAGYGPGTPSLQRSLRGTAYDRPVTASREYLTIMRTLLDGQECDVAGDYYDCHASLVPFPGPPVELGLGVLRPRMARVAGEVADVAITWLTPAPYVRDALLPALRDGARDVGRPVPRVAAIVPAALARPDRDPVQVALASNAGHLSAPHYQDMLRRAGVRIEDGDLPASARALVDGGAFLHGDGPEIACAISAFHEAGVDEVVLNLTGVAQLAGPVEALAELEAVLAAVSAPGGTAPE